jgi:type II secretory pathway pseudopilin PulG
MRTPSRSRRGGWTLVQISVCLAVFSLLLGAILPGLRARARLSRTSEAVDRLAELYRHTQTYWSGQQVGPVAPTRSTLHTLPPPAPLTPAVIPAGRSVVDPPNTWAAPTWNALEFRFEDAHYFAYQYESSGEGTSAGFTARAHGDLDGNGLASTFERAGRADNALVMQPSQGLWIDRATE